MVIVQLERPEASVTAQLKDWDRLWLSEPCEPPSTMVGPVESSSETVTVRNAELDVLSLARSLSASVAATLISNVPSPRLLKSKLPEVELNVWTTLPFCLMVTRTLLRPDASVMFQVKLWFCASVSLACDPPRTIVGGAVSSSLTVTLRDAVVVS